MLNQSNETTVTKFKLIISNSLFYFLGLFLWYNVIVTIHLEVEFVDRQFEVVLVNLRKNCSVCTLDLHFELVEILQIGENLLHEPRTWRTKYVSLKIVDLSCLKIVDFLLCLKIVDFYYVWKLLTVKFENGWLLQVWKSLTFWQVWKSLTFWTVSICDEFPAGNSSHIETVQKSTIFKLAKKSMIFKLGLF